LNKKQELRANYRAGGSIGFTAVARMALAVAKDPQDQERRLIVPVKSSIAAACTPLAFRVSEGRVAWEGPVEVAAEQVLGGSAAPGVGIGKLHKATAFLLSMLGDGPMPAAEVKALAVRDGHTESTLERAKRELRVKVTNHPGGGWLWSLPSPS